MIIIKNDNDTEKKNTIHTNLRKNDKRKINNRNSRKRIYDIS